MWLLYLGLCCHVVCEPWTSILRIGARCLEVTSPVIIVLLLYLRIMRCHVVVLYLG